MTDRASTTVERPQKRPGALLAEVRADWATHYLPFLLVVVLALVAMGVVSRELIARSERVTHDRFVSESFRLSTKLAERMTAYSEVLRAAAGLFDASREVSREEWQRFTQRLDLEHTFRGVLGVGFARHLRGDELAAHVQAVRAEGFPAYEVKPPGVRNDYSAIVYLEPFSGRNLRAFGYDMLSEPVRHAAMTLARDTASLAYSGKVTLVQETSTDVQAGVLVYHPVYTGGTIPETVEGRRNNLVGWTYSPYRMSDLIEAMLRPELDRSGIRLEIYDESILRQEARLYDSEPAGAQPAEAEPLVEVRPLELQGRLWTLRYSALPGFEHGARYPWVELTAISVIAFLMVGIAWESLRARRLMSSLSLSEHRYAMLAEASPVGIFRADATGRCVYVNERWCRLAGRTPDAALSLGWRHAVHPGDAPLVNAEWERTTTSRTDYGQEFRFLHPDGTVVWVYGQAGPVRTADGTLEGFIGTVTDIRERKRMEQAMLESEQRLSRVLKGANDGWWEWDIASGAMSCAPRWWSMLGYDAQVLGSSAEAWRGLTHPDDLSHVAEVLDAALAEGAESYEVEYRMLHKDGHDVPILQRAFIQRDEAGRPVRISGTNMDLTERKEAERQIRELAFYDPLTRLPNRRLLMERLGRAMTASQRTQRYCALLFIDLDQFKVLNDTLGHDAGDRLLVAVADRLVVSVRAGDTVARLGGDEFVVMLEGLGSTEPQAATAAQMVAEKVAAAINAPYSLDGAGPETHHNSCSIGVGLFLGLAEPADVLLKHADLALYQAKESGRNSIRFFSAAMQTTIEARAAMESGLRHAIVRDEFALVFQPQVNSSGRIVGAEALLRWNSPFLPEVGPAEFIPLAEETGQIIQIGRWVLDRACVQLRRWQLRAETRELCIAVNISARQLRHVDFVSDIRLLLDRHQIEPGGLKLELTESALVDNLEDTVAKMQALKRLGVGMSLDDFGQGYSSLSHLRRLPFDQVKIDRSFVRDIAGDSANAAIVQAIIAMGRTLRMDVVAEGVETEGQQRFLEASGCHSFQGYLFSRPVPASEFDRLMAENEGADANGRDLPLGSANGFTF